MREITHKFYECETIPTFSEVAELIYDAKHDIYSEVAIHIPVTFTPKCKRMSIIDYLSGRQNPPFEETTTTNYNSVWKFDNKILGNGWDAEDTFRRFCRSAKKNIYEYAEEYCLKVDAIEII